MDRDDRTVGASSYCTKRVFVISHTVRKLFFESETQDKMTICLTNTEENGSVISEVCLQNPSDSQLY